MQDAERFRLGRYWLDREEGRPNWYRYWYDAGARKTRRASTGMDDFETAKIVLAATVLEEGEQPDDPSQGADPSNVRLITVLNHYWKHYSDKKPRGNDARYAGETVLTYLDGALGRPARVGDLSKARQRAFMKHAHEALGHSVATISRNLSIVNAALNFAADEQIIIDVNGYEREVKLLKFTPKLHYAYSFISEVTGAALPKPRNDIPSLEDLAAYVEEIEDEHLFRYVILALNTWARPGAIVALGPGMVDREHRLLDMLPEGRRQNKKRRPVIAISKTLWGWIEHWKALDVDEKGKPKNSPNWVTWNGKPVASVRKVFHSHLDALAADGLVATPDSINRYALRHLMATVARNSRKPRVPKEQRAIMMGHSDPAHKTTDGYGIFEPDFLREAIQVTDAFMRKLNDAIRARARKAGRHPKRLVVAPTTHPQAEASAEAPAAKTLKLVGKTGGR